MQFSNQGLWVNSKLGFCVVTHWEYVDITLRISGFQQSGSELKAPDYLPFSARPDNVVWESNKKPAHIHFNQFRTYKYYSQYLLRIIKMWLFTSRLQSKAWNAAVFCR